MESLILIWTIKDKLEIFVDWVSAMTHNRRLDNLCLTKRFLAILLVFVERYRANTNDKRDQVPKEIRESDVSEYQQTNS